MLTAIVWIFIVGCAAYWIIYGVLYSLVAIGVAIGFVIEEIKQALCGLPYGIKRACQYAKYVWQKDMD